MTAVAHAADPATSPHVARFDALALDSLADDWRARVQARPRALPEHLSPCCIDHDKGARRHRCSRAHAAVVEGYRLARHAQELRAEAATGGWPNERAAFHGHPDQPTPDRTERPLTFRAFLTASRAA